MAGTPDLIIPTHTISQILMLTNHHRTHLFVWKKKLVYQTTVFLSRSSISLGIPALPARLMPLPAIIQCIIFLALMYESAIGFFGDESESFSIFFVFTLISLEGLCGGSA